MRAKVVGGVLLGLRFAHSLGLVRGHLAVSNIVFDLDHCIQIVGFKRIVLETGESSGEEGTQLGGFSGEGWTPEMDGQAFESILFQIIVCLLAKGETSVLMDFIWSISLCAS
jgi:hypothetical protein